MKKLSLYFLIPISFLFPMQSKADFFGGDLIYLAQILENAIRQYKELQAIMENNKDQLELMRAINQGINDSLNLVRTVYPNIDSGVYNDWSNASDSIKKLTDIYGEITQSPMKRIYQDTDQSVAEAITLNNDIYKYTKNIDELGEVIKDVSHDVSPGGAQKLTAQTLGVVLHVMNQTLRTQATGLKLQAQTIALNNKKEKDSTRQYLDTANTLKQAMKSDNIKFQSPRF